MEEIFANEGYLGLNLKKIAEVAQIDRKLIHGGAALALKLGELYFMVLHARHNGNPFCGIDIKTGDGKLRIEHALRQHVEDLFRIKQAVYC